MKKEINGIKLEKPCKKLGYCPYGPLVERSPLPDKPCDKSCNVFGHICPVFYNAEGHVDTGN